MQSTLFEPSNLPELETAGVVGNTLFVNPVLMMVGLGLLGAMLFLAMHSKGKTKYGLAALGLSAALAGGLYLISELITTDREILSIRARELVSSVANGDEFTMRQLMDENTRVQTRFGSPQGIGPVVSMALSRIPPLIESYSVAEVRSDLPGPRIGRTLVKVRVKGSYLPSSSWWMIHWQRDEADSSDWAATYIEPFWIQGINHPGG